MGKYNKFIVAIVGLVITYLMQRYGADHIVKDVVLVATALGVYQTPNV